MVRLQGRRARRAYESGLGLRNGFHQLFKKHGVNPFMTTLALSNSQDDAAQAFIVFYVSCYRQLLFAEAL